MVKVCAPPTNISAGYLAATGLNDGGVTDLINALNAYNAEHPDAPKDFTFPGM